MDKINNNYWVKSGFFAISQRISIPLFGIGTFLVIVRSLTKADMGTWALFMTLTGIIEVARNGLIKAALVKHFTGATSGDKLLVITSSFYINLIYTVLIQLLLVIFSGFLAQFFKVEELAYMFVLYSISALFFIPFSHFEYVQQANLNFKGIFISYFIKQGIFFVFIFVTIVLLKIELNLYHLVLMQSVGVMLGAFSSYLTARKFLKHSIQFSLDWIRKLLDFGKYGLYTNISNSALTTADHVLIGGLLSSASVAVHNVAIRITNVFIIPSVAIADILYPKTVKANNEKGTEEVRNLYHKAVGATLVPMIPVILVVQAIPEFIITVLAGDKYLEATLILRITIFGIMLMPFLKQFGTVMNTIGKPQYNFYFVLGIAVVNVGLNYAFIGFYGIIGGAIATLISYFIGFVSCQIVLKKLVNVSTKAVIHQMTYYYIQIFKWSREKLTRR